jgi:predicted O-linked N-acetylglucosamine transferase (SPINDLY family)
MGASFMRALGRSDWVAEDAQAYVQIAARLARDCDVLRGQRAALRQRMAASPLCDIQGYVGHFEALLQRMWALHCQGADSRLIGAASDQIGARPSCHC